MRFKTDRFLLWLLLACCPLRAVSQTPAPDGKAATRPHAADSAPSTVCGFELRGTKGFFWTPAQYLEEIPVLKSYGMNFLVTCYGSFFRGYAFEKGCNEWWAEMDDGLKRAWRQVVRACRRNGINFCFGTNPMLYSSRPLDTASEEDFERLLALYRWFQDQGVGWFYLALDDLHLHKGMRVDGRGQSLFVNRLYKALLQHDPSCRMIFCPTWYWGSTMKNPDKRAYLEEVAEFLDKDILTFWTGNDVVSTTVTAADAAAYREAIGHELILWDNYPVNDFHNTLNLGPLTGRDPKLCGVVRGIMANPMRDNRMNRLPLYTMAEYMNDPANYSPEESIVRAVDAAAGSESGREALHSLVRLYPGGLVSGYTSTKYSVIRLRFERLLHDDTAAARRLAEELARTIAQFEQAFPKTCADTKRVLHNDLKWMNEQLSN